MKFIFLLFVFCYGLSVCNAQKIDADFLLHRLDSLQVKEDNFFLAGTYPSYINSKQKFASKKKDQTIFYNILIDLILKKIRPKLNAQQQIFVDTLLARSAKLYPLFYHASRGSYNFWRRDTAYRFPYSWWIPLIKKDANVSDDMDDTSLAQLINPDDSIKKLHGEMQAYTNLSTKVLKTTDKKYRRYNAYSAWFGKDFPVVFDVCVLTNILSFVQTYHLQWTHADSSSLQLIIETIKNKDYVYHPLYVSPYYGKTSIILYHISRLMQIKKIDELEQLKPELIQECYHQFETTNNVLIKIILANALYRFGKNLPDINLPDQSNWQKEIEQNNFPFFIGNIPSYLHNGIKKFFVQRKLLLYYHYCAAYNDALALEYLMNKK